MIAGVRAALLGAGAMCVGVASYAGTGWDIDDIRRCVGVAAGIASSGARAAAHVFEPVIGNIATVRDDGQIDLGDVAEMVDIVQLGLSAGLSFDAALELYCGGRPGRLPSELARAELMWRVGALTRERALMEIARASGVEALESFAVSAVQAVTLGAPLGETLARQSRDIKSARRAEVERRIERAPVRLLVPTGALVLPALLISIMGPLMAAAGMV